MNKEINIHRLVVKCGTTNLCNLSGKLDQKIFNDFARQIFHLMKEGIGVVVVSSGAIKSGGERLKNLGLKNPFNKKELAAIGARHLLNRWGEALGNYKLEAAQIWVTYANWRNPREKKNIKDAIENFLTSKIIVPIVNESDVISDEEIKSMEKGFSENDKLARMIAFLINADAVLFLTNEKGVYEKDPKVNPQARLYQQLPTIWEILPKQSISTSWSNSCKTGTGGMLVKWREASYCARKGMKVAIAGNEKDVILRFMKGESVGTKIVKGGRIGILLRKNKIL